MNEGVFVISCQRCHSAIANQSMFDPMGNQVFLCAACAHQAYFQHGAGAVQKFLLPVLQTPSEIQAPCCPNCGITLQQLRQTSHLGCAECYRHFRQQILPAVQRMQGTLRHGAPEVASDVDEPPQNQLDLGQLTEPRSPDAEISTPEPTRSLDELQQQLEQSLVAENYELAARIRDRIRELRSEGP